jgi:triphosphoribosyl-dephospho-CoA synthetase
MVSRITTPNEKCAAIVTIRDADKMSEAGRERIADWMRQQAEQLVTEGHTYDGTFRGKYLYR